MPLCLSAKIAAIDILGNANVVMENLWGDAKGDIKISREGVKGKTVNKVYLKNVSIPHKIKNADPTTVVYN